MPTLTPSQCRAARALVGLSQAEFANVAGIHQRTVIALELGENAPSRATIMRVVAAFGRLGIELIAEGEGRGAGVRLMEPEGGAVVVRRDVLRNGDELGVVLRVAGRPVTARVEVAALDAAGDTDAALAGFDLHRVAIANAMARKLEAGAVDADGHIRLRAADLASTAARAA